MKQNSETLTSYWVGYPKRGPLTRARLHSASVAHQRAAHFRLPPARASAKQGSPDRKGPRVSHRPEQRRAPASNSSPPVAPAAMPSTPPCSPTPSAPRHATSPYLTSPKPTRRRPRRTVALGGGAPVTARPHCPVQARYELH
jgi:hypothetical protein